MMHFVINTIFPFQSVRVGELGGVDGRPVQTLGARVIDSLIEFIESVLQ